MNHAYRLVWSHACNAWVAVAEFVRSHGKGAVVTAAAVLLVPPALAGTPAPTTLPSGGQVVAGQATIATQGARMDITQGSAKAILNWDSFSIGSAAQVNFAQPSSSAVALNRVTGGAPSAIFGKLNANGQVFLVNASGIVFAPGAQVDVGGLVASTLSLADGDFLAGNHRFTAGNGAAGIEQHGDIRTAAGGYVALLAPRILQAGHINAPQGTVALGAGDTVSLQFAGDRLISFAVSEASVDAVIDNRQAIRAEGGTVLLSAAAKSELASSVVNNSGLVDASSLSSEGGVIRLGSSHAVINSGSVQANGATQGGRIEVDTVNLADAGQWQANATGGSGGSIAIAARGSVEQTVGAQLQANGLNGGSIRLTADTSAWLSGGFSASSFAGGQGGGRIALSSSDLVLAGARLRADGTAGGGTIHIGGGWQGLDAGLPNAGTTRVNGSTTISANALDRGQGGEVVVWSQDRTEFAGTIEARGGATGGDGGRVEVSSHDKLAFAGHVTTAAPNGRNGRLLLDPANLTIDDGVGAVGSFVGAPLNNGNRAVTALTTGNLVVADPSSDFADTDAGAVYLYKPDGTLISSVYGTTANDGIGSNTIVQLSNGNFVTRSSNWDNGTVTNAGAVTWGSGTTGFLSGGGAVSALNSLVGSTANDQVGFTAITQLTGNGNYVVPSSSWDNGTIANAGAVTWGNGTAGVVGAVSSSNSLVGTSTSDGVGVVTALTNGNYVVVAQNWDNGTVTNVGAATWGNGSTGITGAVSSSNSLVGTTSSDQVGITGVTALTNGNYVVASQNWRNGTASNAGAVTWGDGTAGITGAVSSSNSLVGTTGSDQVGSGLVVALSNGNYVVKSSMWDNGTAGNAGAVTWGNGTSGVTGAVSSSNSLVGSTGVAGTLPGDGVGASVTTLSNGNYLVVTSNWDNGTVADAGAVTWGNGSTGTAGVVSSSNSLVGGRASDAVGATGILELTNGHYIVRSNSWDNGTVTNVGAVTWGNGTSGVTGVVSSSNSLVGSTANDQVGSSGVTALTNGNYVVVSQNWDNGTVTNVGAVTWGNGTSGVTGVVSSSNSLVGSTASDGVGATGITALTNGNYVVRSSNWDNGTTADTGAVTWGNGTSGVTGAVSSSNSLVGTTASDQLGSTGVAALTNGNYVVRSSAWDSGTVTDVGAVTWGNGTAGVTGAVSSSNSLVGSTASDQVGASGVTALLTNGNYVVQSNSWRNGTAASAGAVTWGNGTIGVTGVVSSSNSLVGTTGSDTVGSNGITALSNGNYVVRSGAWDNGTATNAGAATWANGTTGITGVVSSSNSLVGTSNNDAIGGGITTLRNGHYVIVANNWDNGTKADAGSATWGNGTSGVTGVVSSSNSVVGNLGRGTNQATNVVELSNGNFTVSHVFTGQVTIFNTQTSASYGDSVGSDNHLSARLLLDLLNAGNAVTLQASNDITVARALTVNNLSGNGGNLTLQAGRSLLLNASVTTDNGNLTLIANDRLANGVVDADRSAGAAEITMASGTSINAGTGSVSITLRDGAGLTNSTSGNINLRDINAQTISALNQGATAGSGVVLNGTLTAAATSGTGIELSGKTFTNNTGGSALSVGVGSRWLVWSADPTGDTRNGLAYDFKQYNATQGVTSVAGSGNGFLYTLAPTLSQALTGSVTKTYDGTTSATLAAGNYGAVSGAIDGDTVTLNQPGAGSYDTKDVGSSGKTVSVSGITVASATDGAATVYGYQVGTASGAIGAITPKAITANGITADNKTYDGTTTATIHTGSAALVAGGVVSGDTVSLDASGASGSFATKDAANGKAVTISGLTLTGTDAGNYTVSDAGSTTANITAKAITANGVTANGKTYDATTTATLNTGSAALVAGGVISGDTVNLDTSSASGSFANKNVANGKAITVSGLTLTGSDAGNYTVSDASGATANITAKAITANGITANGKTYDATTVVTLNTGSAALVAGGVISGDTVNLDASAASGSFANKNVANGKAVTISGLTLTGTDAGNYTVSDASSATANITAKAITANGITASGKTYDATTNATLNTGSAALVAGGVISGDTVNLDATGASGSFANKNVANGKAVTVSGLTLTGTDAGNYTVSDASSATANITAKAITANGITANSKTYDATTTATLNTGSGALVAGGVISGDTVSLDTSGAAGSFANKNVANGKAVTISGLTLTGTDAGNYTVSDASSATANVTAKAIAANGITANGKTYDATTAATLNTGSAALVAGGVISGDTVSLDTSGASGSFANKNVANGKAVTISGLTLTGTDAGNYTVSDASSATANITAKAITANGITASGKTYDATTNVTLNTGSAALVAGGVISGDTVNLDTSGASGSFANKNVANGKAVTVSGLMLTGSDAGNYTVSDASSATANVTAKAIAANGITANGKTYDATTAATLNTGSAALVAGGVISGDTVSLDTSSASGSFANKNVGNGKAVTVSGLMLTGTDAGNYTVSDASSATASITPRALSANGITVTDKVYDATTVASLNTGGTSLAGVITGDTVNLDASGATGAFANKNVGTGKTVAISGLTLIGADAGNYTVDGGTTASITPRALSANGITATDKVYDATTVASLNTGSASLAGVISGDTVNLDASGASGNFANRNASTGKAVTISGLALTGTDASNYTVSDASGATASITPKALTVSGITASDKTHDGNAIATINTSNATLVAGGVIAGDAVSLDASAARGSFATFAVGSNIPVFITGLSLSGSAAGNYSVTDTSGALANINASSSIAQLLFNPIVSGVSPGAVLAPTVLSLSSAGSPAAANSVTPVGKGSNGDAVAPATSGTSGTQATTDAGSKDGGASTGQSSSDASKPAESKGDKPRQATTPSFGGLFRSSLSFQLEGER